MESNELIELCGGKDNFHKYYLFFDNTLGDFLERAKLDHSEKSFKILKEISELVVKDIGESWYRRSLGK